MIVKIIAYCIFFATFFVVAKNIPIDYKYDDYKDFINILINISGMIFTIMGIWIAFLYPNALSSRPCKTPTPRVNTSIFA